MLLIESIKENPKTRLSQLGLPSDLVGVNEVDGFRMTFSNGAIVHLRPSGNAPELRCYAESYSEKNALGIAKSVLSTVSKLN